MAAISAGRFLCTHGTIPVGGLAQRVVYLDVCETCLERFFGCYMQVSCRIWTM